MDASVSFSVSTRQGQSYEATTPLNVPAHSQRTVPVASFVEGTGGIAISYTSTGSPVSVFLQQSVIRGLVPGGLSVSAAATERTTEQVITGVVVAGAERQREIGNRDEYLDATNEVRVYSPSRDVEATIRVIGEGGEVLSDALSVPAASVAELDLSALDDGTYTVVVSAPTPVAAAVRLTRGGDGEPDLQWIPAQQQVVSQADFATSALNVGEARLVLSSSEAQSVQLTAADGTTQDIELSAGLKPASMVLARGVSYRITGQSPVYGAVIVGDGNRVAGYAVTSAPSAATGVTVAP